MRALQQRLMAADRVTVLRFLSQLIHDLTIHTRAHYGERESQTVVIETNEAIHRVSGHLRDLVNEGEMLTESRAEAIAADAHLLLSSELERLVIWSKV